jgi:integrase
MSHIEQCRNLWYATLKVPEDLRERVGKTKFKKSLGTADKRRAQTLAAPLVALWKAQLRKAAGTTDAVHVEAIRWREAIAEASAAGDQEAVFIAHSLVAETAERIEEQRGAHEGGRFADVALGLKSPSSLHLDEWKASIKHLRQKTQDQMVKDVGRFVGEFPMLEDITPQAARRWIATLQKDGVSIASLERMLSFWRNYWKFLGSVEAVAPNSFPFSMDFVRRTKGHEEESWVPFPAEDVPRLWTEAREGGDEVLGDLITLGAYTGARIRELCSIKLTDISASSFRITDSKTAAGIREVPIHSAIRPLVDRLTKTATDDYLVPGLTFNKYGSRSDAIGKRFGRLKTRLGYGESHVFHSIRKTVVTLLEDAGVTENLAADIVGHEKPRITYGLYSGGASLSTKAHALELVNYPTAGELPD